MSAPTPPLTVEMLEQTFKTLAEQPLQPDKTVWVCCGRAGYVWGPAKCPNCGRELP